MAGSPGIVVGMVHEIGTLGHLLELQSGVVARRQVLAAGQTDNDIRRRLRRRAWAQVHPGVYVDHTGALTWLQRAWAAVLFAEPAALCHDSALRADDGPGRRDGDEGARSTATESCERHPVSYCTALRSSSRRRNGTPVHRVCVSGRPRSMSQPRRRRISLRLRLSPTSSGRAVRRRRGCFRCFTPARGSHDAPS